MIKHLSCAAALAAALVAAPAAAQWSPKGPVRIVVPFAPGGPTDITARHLAKKLPEILGQPVLIDNRAGANGMIGAELVVRSKPDGQTLLMPTSSTVAINPVVYDKMPFNPVTDLAPITPVVSTPGVLVVTPSLPAKTVKDFVALARSRPGEIVFASTGPGSNTHLALELFADQVKIKVTHVPYKGAGPAVADVVGGHAQALIADLPVLVPHIKSARLRPLAITAPARTKLFPDIPSMKELGLPRVDSRNWYAVFAPAGTPSEIINRLNQAVREAVAAPEVRDPLVGLGADIFLQTPEEFGRFLKSEIERWRGVVTRANIKLEM
jgi:tripartite-type tricarboxylate transporter receptor subunit TctC